jgi:hypothetical protein
MVNNLNVTYTISTHIVRKYIIEQNIYLSVRLKIEVKFKFYIFPIKLQLFVTAKSEQDPNPDPHGCAIAHWFGSLDPDQR